MYKGSIKDCIGLPLVKPETTEEKTLNADGKPAIATGVISSDGNNGIVNKNAAKANGPEKMEGNKC